MSFAGHNEKVTAELTDMSCGTMVVCYLSNQSSRDYDGEMRCSEATVPYSKERRFRRYNLEFPVFLTFSAEEQRRELAAISQNVSTGGLLLRASHQVALHTRVNLTMKVKGRPHGRPLHLEAEGEVVRVERLGLESGYAIAIECEHPWGIERVTEVGG